MIHAMQNAIITGLLLFLLSSCATLSSAPLATEATAETYTQSGATKGVVVLAVNWSRRWNCGGFENAEIMSMGFDRLPIKDGGSDDRSEVFIDEPPRLMKKPIFLDYALLLEPGQYALTSADVKAARSTTDVGHFRVNRSSSTKNGKPVVGSFDVNAGEVVYIGNFFLDCHQQPMIWRYYTEGRDGFKSHMAGVKQKYPFIDPDNVQYRLFQTSTIGQDYELPE